MKKPKIKKGFFILIFFSLFFPFFVKAQGPLAFFQYLLSGIFKIYEAGVLFILFLKLAILIASSISGFLALGLSIVLQPGLMGNWSYTQNPFVDAGLEITQGFISIGLVLALVWIAFATILRLEGYDTKRLLVRLIIAGLLVYFSRVICGLIVDASNIFMYYFSDRIAGVGILTNNLVLVGRQLLEALAAIVNPLAWPRIIAESIILISVQFYLITLLIAFFLLFLFRYAAIWIAVILAPIAFICWILPATRKYWEEWWKNFIGWCLAGPITAFFLYLAARAGEVITHQPLGQQLVQVFSGWRNIAPIVPHFFTLGLLQLGIIYGVKGAGWGGNLAIAFAQKGTGWVRGKMAGWGMTPGGMWRRALGMPLGTPLEPILGKERVEQWRKRFEERAMKEAVLPRPGEGMPGAKGVVVRTAGWPIWAIRQKVGETFGPAQIEAEKTRLEAIEKEALGKRIEEQLTLFRKTKNPIEQLGRLRAIIRDRNIEAAMDTLRFGTSAIQQAEIEALYEVAERLGKVDVIRSTFPQMARRHLPPGTVGQAPPGITQTQYETQHIFRQIRPDHYSSMARGVLQDKEFVESLIRVGSPVHLHAFIDRFYDEGADAFEERLKTLAQAAGMTPRQFLQSVNPRLYHYITRGGARGLIHI